MTSTLTLQDWQARASGLKLSTQATIDGRPHPGSAPQLDAVTPATGKALAKIASCNEEDIDMAVKAARRAFESGVWSGMPRLERKKRMLKLAELITQHAEEL